AGAEDEADLPLSSAAGGAALGACRTDHRRADRGVLRARGDAQLPAREDRHSAPAHDGGVLILALMVLRFIVRMRPSRPPAATTGYLLLARMAPVSHYGFYVLVLMMVGSGFATAIIAGLGEIVFASSGAPLPPTLMTYPPFVAHVSFAMLLAGFVALHVLAAFYHQFVRRDGLFRRMSFGRRPSEPLTVRVDAQTRETTP